MKTKFIIFFSLVALAAILSVLDSWIIQYESHGVINVIRAIGQVALVALILCPLWRRSMPSYVLALGYAISVAILYGYELTLYFLLGNIEARLPTSATIISVLLILSTVCALIILLLDYVDYRSRRVSTNLTDENA